jgi:hypothetical protein
MTLKILSIGIVLLIFNSCDTDDSIPKPQSNSINRIVALGASRVESNRPEYESFRVVIGLQILGCQTSCFSAHQEGMMHVKRS